MRKTESLDHIFRTDEIRLVRPRFPQAGQGEHPPPSGRHHNADDTRPRLGPCRAFRDNRIRQAQSEQVPQDGDAPERGTVGSDDVPCRARDRRAVHGRKDAGVR